MQASNTRRATHEGECQLCGHQQKLPNGRLSLHGYTVAWGFFSGTCPGSRDLPYELSCDAIKARIPGVIEMINEANERARAIEAERATVWVHEYIPATFKRGERHSRYEWRGIAVADMIEIGYETKWIGLDGKVQRTNVYGVHGIQRGDYIADLNAKRAHAIHQYAEDCERYLAWLRRRVSSWKLRALKPVADDEVRGPVTHAVSAYYLSNFGHARKACSPQGGMRGYNYNAVTTYDLSKVNCTRCRKMIEQRAASCATEALAAKVQA